MIIGLGGDGSYLLIFNLDCPRVPPTVFSTAEKFRLRQENLGTKIKSNEIVLAVVVVLTFTRIIEPAITGSSATRITTRGGGLGGGAHDATSQAMISDSCTWVV